MATDAALFCLPSAPSAVPALTAADFLAGKQARPNLVSLEDGKVMAASARSAAISAPAPASASAPAPAPVAEHAPAPAPSAERKLPEPARAVEQPAPKAVVRPASPVKMVRQNGASAAPSPSPASPTPGPGADTRALQEEVELLKEEMAKRDGLIRKLELENERLRANERRVREVIGGQ